MSGVLKDEKGIGYLACARNVRHWRKVKQGWETALLLFKCNWVLINRWLFYCDDSLSIEAGWSDYRVLKNQSKMSDTVNIPLTLNLTSDVMPREQTTTNIVNASTSKVCHKRALSLRRKENKKVRHTYVIVLRHITQPYNYVSGLVGVTKCPRVNV